MKGLQLSMDVILNELLNNGRALRIQLHSTIRGITIEAMESGCAGVTDGGGMAQKDDVLRRKFLKRTQNQVKGWCWR